jgi:tripartite-type tricarboxylate transporter receptor subunit TctC
VEKEGQQVKNRIVVLAFLFVSLIAFVATSYAQQVWTPTKPITIIAHYGPGASFTKYARGIAPYLSKQLGVDVQVLVKSGADGIIGTTYVWRSKPDGYTLGIIDLAKMVTYNMVKDMEFETRKFKWITNPNGVNFVMAVPASLPWRTVKDLIAAGKKKPIRQVSARVGRNELIPVAVLDINHTQVTGSAGGSESVLMMLRGEADLITVSDAMLLPYFKSGDLRPILSFGSKRNKRLADNGIDVPSSAEAGYQPLNAMRAVRGIVAPPKTPDYIVKTLEEAFMKAYADPGLIAWSKKANYPLNPENAKQVRESVEAMYKLFGPWKDLLAPYIGK